MGVTPAGPLVFTSNLATYSSQPEVSEIIYLNSKNFFGKLLAGDTNMLLHIRNIAEESRGKGGHCRRREGSHKGIQ